MKGFRLYYDKGYCNECNVDEQETLGYFVGEVTLEKLQKLARKMYRWLSEEQFKEVVIDKDLHEFYWLRGGWHKCDEYYVEEIELEEI